MTNGVNNMLLSYRFSNMLSYQTDTEFSMKAGRRLPEHLTDNVVKIEPGMRICKSAIIVGENAGGKTNFIDSLDYFQSMLVATSRVYALENTINWNCVANQAACQEFQIEALVERKKYRYTVRVNRHCVEEEKLEIIPANKAGTEIFEMKLTKMDVQANDKRIQAEYALALRENVFPKNVQEKITDAIISNAYQHGMMIGLIASLDSEAQPFYDWFANKLVIARSPYVNLEIKDDKGLGCAEIDIMKDVDFLDIFRMVDSTIAHITIDEKDPFRESTIFHINNAGREYDCKLKMESAGVREFFAWSIKIWQVTHENKTVFADEVDKVLNPVLASKIMSYINGSEHKGQFIFTTHNLLHLNTAYFSKEQMWFVHKDEDTLNSELYSLASFKDFRYATHKNVYELYLKGLLGGVGNG